MNELFVKIHHGKIYEVLNFLTINENNIFLNIIENAQDDDWPQFVNNQFVADDPQWSNKTLFLENRGFKFDHIDERIQSFFYNAHQINQISSIQRNRSNEGMGIHTDDVWEAEVKFGAVIYINDEYEGGEINYPRLGLSIKPKARSLIIHPAGEPHEALPVQSEKNRYILSVFVRGDETTKVQIKGEHIYVK